MTSISLLVSISSVFIISLTLIALCSATVLSYSSSYFSSCILLCIKLCNSLIVEFLPPPSILDCNSELAVNIPKLLLRSKGITVDVFVPFFEVTCGSSMLLLSKT